MSEPCETCGHLAVIHECEHARAGAQPTPVVDLAIVTTAMALALVAVVAQRQAPEWLCAWAYLVAIALAAWTPSRLVVPLAILGVIVPLVQTPLGPMSVAAAVVETGLLGIAVIVIRRARRQRDELVARRAGELSGDGFPFRSPGL